MERRTTPYSLNKRPTRYNAGHHERRTLRKGGRKAQTWNQNTKPYGLEILGLLVKWMCLLCSSNPRDLLSVITTDVAGGRHSILSGALLIEATHVRPVPMTMMLVYDAIFPHTPRRVLNLPIALNEMLTLRNSKIAVARKKKAPGIRVPECSMQTDECRQRPLRGPQVRVAASMPAALPQ